MEEKEKVVSAWVPNSIIGNFSIRSDTIESGTSGIYNGYCTTSNTTSNNDAEKLKMACLLNKAEDLIVACLDSNRVMDQTAATEFLTEWRKMK